MGEWLGRSIELDVTKIAHGGVTVARYDNRVVFVSDAIPGERVLARVTEDAKPSFWRADTMSVLAPSGFRQAHVWESASLSHDPVDRVGGAEFGHIQLVHQRELKRQVLAEALERMAGLTLDALVEPLADEHVDGLGWRTRVGLHVDADGRVGPFAARSHRVIVVPDLPLATRKVQLAAASLGRQPTSKSEGRRVDLVVSSSGQVRVLRPGSPADTLTEQVGDRHFTLNDTGFWQVHRGAAGALSSAVASAIDAVRFDPIAANLDLYGGVGLFAASVADRLDAHVHITTVEGDAAASGHAATNLADLPNARAERGQVQSWLENLAATSSAAHRERLTRGTVILDPPRSGAGRAVVDLLAEIAPAQAVYVACDPIAFARDVGYFAGHGYRLAALRAFDLFPNTHHLEAVGTLVRE